MFPPAFAGHPYRLQVQPGANDEAGSLQSLRKHFEPNDICKKCYAHALTKFHLEVVNKVSAERTASSPAPAALGNIPRYTGVVNSCTHPMCNEIHPPALREGRRVGLILGHEARRGNGPVKPRLSYVIKYQICDDPRLSAKV